MEVGDEIRNISVAYGAGGDVYVDDSGSDQDNYADKRDEEAAGIGERKIVA